LQQLTDVDGGSPVETSSILASLIWHDGMKQKLIGLSQRYVAALQKYLRQGPQANLQPAVSLGRQAVALGLETLDLARIHERTLAILKLSSSKNGTIKPIKRAQIFFTEAITPIVETHRAARQGKINLNRLNATLSRRTVKLAAATRQLQRGTVRRKAAEAAFKISGAHHTKLLQESLQLQDNLRKLTHQALRRRKMNARRSALNFRMK
jgi:hypothetical protein